MTDRVIPMLSKLERAAIKIKGAIDKWAFPKKGLSNLKADAKPIHRRKPARKQPEITKAAEAAAEVQIGERGVVEWASLLVYSVLALLAYQFYSLLALQFIAFDCVCNRAVAWRNVTFGGIGYGITSSAVANSVSGMLRPRASDRRSRSERPPVFRRQHPAQLNP
jgi:hypothetical protein